MNLLITHEFLIVGVVAGGFCGYLLRIYLERPQELTQKGRSYIVDGNIQEIHLDPSAPSCHVCGCEMVPKEWRCLSCGVTTGATEAVFDRSAQYPRAKEGQYGL